MGAEEVAAWFSEAYASHGMGGTLDYSQCYDMMHPEVAAAAMAPAGYSPAVAEIMRTIWSSQERWIQWDRHTCAEPLTQIEAMPQDDPFGPLVLNVYMLAGWI